MARRAEPTFELSGGALCLDFANTWGDRDRSETDDLHRYEDLLAFARQAKVLERGAVAALAKRAARRPEAAERALATALDLREALYRIFAARRAGESPEGEDLERLDTALAETSARRGLVVIDDSFAWTWRGLADSLDAPLAPIAHSATELLTGDEADRVRECDGDRCTWLFLDTSRNRSRRWCSMEICGNRAKARRHYHRTRRSADRA